MPNNSSTPVMLEAADLDNNGGVFCPSPKAGMAVWNNHPKVYIHVAATGEGRCPYCGTVYQLKSGVVASAH
jgi:uncharacterized Zn-finger protein